MSRVLVDSGKPGWYIDVANPEGKKVRKTDEDDVFDDIVEARKALKVLEKVHSGSKAVLDSAAATDGASEPEEPKEPAPVTVAPTGKKLVGQTITIKCKWKGEDNKSGKMCGKERVIKPQDAFQVKYCVEHQAKHRRQKVSEKRKAKRLERRRIARGAKA